MFMGGVVGKMMQEFALVLSAAVVISVFLALTFTPMLCGRFLRQPEPARNGVLRALESGFAAVERGYARGLDVVLRHMPLTMVFFFLTLTLTVALYATAKTGFFPQQDAGFLQGTMVTAQGSTYANTDLKAHEVIKIITADPDIDEAHYTVANGDSSQTNFNIGLRSRHDGRTASATDIINRLRPQLTSVVGAQTILQATQDITIGARPARAQYQYTLSDGDPEAGRAQTAGPRARWRPCRSCLS